MQGYIINKFQGRYQVDPVIPVQIFGRQKKKKKKIKKENTKKYNKNEKQLNKNVKTNVFKQIFIY